MFCSSCGQTVREKARFCPTCGAPTPLLRQDPEIRLRSAAEGDFCYFCGAEMPSDARFCPRCGRPAEARRHCAVCGEALDDAALFCEACGARVLTLK